MCEKERQAEAVRIVEERIETLKELNMALLVLKHNYLITSTLSTALNYIDDDELLNELHIELLNYMYNSSVLEPKIISDTQKKNINGLIKKCERICAEQ